MAEERQELDQVDATQLYVHDKMEGALLPLFIFGPDHPGGMHGASQLNASPARPVGLNEKSVAILVSSGIARVVIVDRNKERETVPAPRLKVEFNVLSDEKDISQFIDDMTFRPIATPQAPFDKMYGILPMTVQQVPAMAHLGLIPVLAHTSYKFMRYELLGTPPHVMPTVRFMFERMANVEGISNPGFVTAHTLFFCVPKLHASDMDTIKGEVTRALEEIAEYDWRIHTEAVHRYEGDGEPDAPRG